VSAPLLYPFTLGMLASVNPCGFPLLPAYLELFVGRGGTDGEDAGLRHDIGARAGRAVAAGAFCTAGFVGLFGLLGLLVSLGWAAVSVESASAARYFMVAAGIGMAAVGSAGLLRRPFRLRLPEIRGGLGLRRPVALTIFGVSYGVASIGCALPLFIGGVATTFTRADSLSGSADFVSYALGMGAVLAALALAVAVCGPSVARPLRRLSRYVPVVGSALLVLLGVYVAGDWLNAIVEPTASAAPERLVTSLQSRVAAGIDDHAVLVGSVLGAIIFAAILASELFGHRRPSTADMRECRALAEPGQETNPA
jgi:cytochrome c biogenesis protein CcdA